MNKTGKDVRHAVFSSIMDVIKFSIYCEVVRRGYFFMLNQWVLHRLYGIGHIVEVQGDLITVRFSEADKVFSAVQAMPQGALKLLNAKVEAQFLAQLTQKPAAQSAPSHPAVAATSFACNQTYSNAEINAQFDGQTSGRIRRGDRALVLIAEASDQVNAEGQFMFSGVGQSGNQSLTKAPNKTLVNAGDAVLHVFAPAPHRAYTYLGQAKLVADPVAVVQPDRHGDDRQVWQFPLQFN